MMKLKYKQMAIKPVKRILDKVFLTMQSVYATTETECWVAQQKKPGENHLCLEWLGHKINK